MDVHVHGWLLIAPLLSARVGSGSVDKKGQTTKGHIRRRGRIYVASNRYAISRRVEPDSAST